MRTKTLVNAMTMIIDRQDRERSLMVGVNGLNKQQRHDTERWIWKWRVRTEEPVGEREVVVRVTAGVISR